MYELFYGWILPITLAGSVAVGLSLLFYPVLKKLRWVWQQLILSVTFLFFWIPVGSILKMLSSTPAKPLIGLQQVGSALKTAARTAAGSVQSQPIPGASAAVTPAAASVTVGVGERVLVLLPWIWAMGVAAAVLWQAIGYVRFCRALNTCSVEMETEKMNQLHSMCLAMGRMTPVRICQSGLIRSPLLVGVVQPKLYVPQGMENTSLQMALRHELAHLRKADLWLKLLVRLACDVHWFNPLCRWQAMRLEKVCEFACDEQATAGFTKEERKIYAGILLQSATACRLPAGTSGMGGSYKNMKKRLEAIFDPKQEGGKQKFVLIGAAAIVLVLTAVVSVSFAVPPMPQTEDDSMTQDNQFLKVSESDAASIEDAASEQQLALVESGTLVWPVPEDKGVSRWMSSCHHGTDIRADEGAPVLAMESGRITAAQWHYSYGNYVQIDHGNGTTTLYAHLSKLSVTEGQDVNQGDETVWWGVPEMPQGTNAMWNW